jgi:hypothetical protein
LVLPYLQTPNTTRAWCLVPWPDRSPIEGSLLGGSRLGVTGSGLGTWISSVGCLVSRFGSSLLADVQDFWILSFL